MIERLMKITGIVLGSAVLLLVVLVVVNMINLNQAVKKAEKANKPVTSTQTLKTTTSEVETNIPPVSETDDSTASETDFTPHDTDPSLDSATLPPVSETVSPLVTTTKQPVESATLPPVQEGVIDNEWALWLINGKNPLPEGYAPKLSSIGSYGGDSRELDSRAAPYAIKMMEDAQSEGISLVPASSYRRVSTQETNFRNAFNSYVNSGYSRERAFDLTAEECAVPGTSEHNAGVSIDFNQISESFDQTAAFRWLRANAHKYGFIMRYPKGTKDITGIIYEPWHFRFVGIYHAEQIYNSGKVLEQYIGVCAGDDSVVAAWRASLVG